MRITIISTSPRKNSISLRLAMYLKNLLDAAESGYQVVCLDMEDCDLPFVGRGSLDPENLSPFQANYTKKWAAADVVIFTIPEYNWSTGGEFINALHVLGGKPFAHLFDGKVFALAGVSTGRGGRLPAVEINMILGKVISFLGKHAIISPKLMESHETGRNISPEGESVGNAIYEKSAQDFLDYTMEIASRWNSRTNQN